MKLLAIFALICAFALLVSAVDDKKDGSLASFETELVDVSYLDTNLNHGLLL